MIFRASNTQMLTIFKGRGSKAGICSITYLDPQLATTELVQECGKSGPEPCTIPTLKYN